MKTARTNVSTLKQICQLIPPHLVSKLAQKHGVDKQSRAITPWNHLTALMYSQLSHALSLNDVCDGLKNHSSQLSTIRGAKPPSRNGFSNANRNRNSEMAEDLFWTVLGHLHNQSVSFGGQSYQGMPRRFKRTINVIDSTTISLVANSMEWAKHRRRKAAAKCHMCLDLGSFLPQFAVVDSAKHSDPKMAYEVCANIKSGEIAVFDKAYVDFKHLNLLDQREVFWITRAKSNMQYKIVEELPVKEGGKIITDAFIELTKEKTYKQYPKSLRMVTALVEVNGKEQEMTFISNNQQWAASSICDLYKSRWSIEVFFKQIKQTLQLCDFLGHNEHAVKWQIWTALLVYVLLRFLAHTNKWTHSFSRLFTLIRGVLWSKLKLGKLLTSYGTASGQKRFRASPEQAYLPGFLS